MTDVATTTNDRAIVDRIVAQIGQSAIGPYHPVSKAASVADGFANRLAMTHTMRNENPALAREHLIGAFAVWPVLCRVIAELEQAYPEHAGEGGAQGRQMVERLDRRDRTGDYA